MDCLEFTQTYTHFFKLDKMVDGGGGIGGTKGETLHTTCRDIYVAFKDAVERIKVVEYDILDITAAVFDEDYAAFKVGHRNFTRQIHDFTTTIQTRR